jgi:hypothetical protein
MTLVFLSIGVVLLGIGNYFLSVRPRLRTFDDYLRETDDLRSWWALPSADPRPGEGPNLHVVPNRTVQAKAGSTASRNSRTRPSPSPGHSITR